MAIHLPTPIAEYFTADQSRSAEAVAACFAADAIVIDEGHTYAGRPAIREWMASSSIKYTYTVEPFAIEPEGLRIVVTSHLAGAFPGSPTDLRYIFELADGKIAQMEIVP